MIENENFLVLICNNHLKFPIEWLILFKSKNKVDVEKFFDCCVKYRRKDYNIGLRIFNKESKEILIEKLFYADGNSKSNFEVIKSFSEEDFKYFYSLNSIKYNRTEYQLIDLFKKLKKADIDTMANILYTNHPCCNFCICKHWDCLDFDCIGGIRYWLGMEWEGYWDLENEETDSREYILEE